MSISQSQYLEAKLFLNTYGEAITVLKESAQQDALKKQYNKFLANFCDWKKKRIQMDENLYRKIKLFQFSQYFFMKHFPNINTQLETPMIIQMMRDTSKALESSKRQ